MNLGWIPLVLLLSFLGIFGFGWLKFSWEFLCYIHQRCWPIIFLFGSIFVWFWYKGDVGFIECLWECSFLFNLLEKFKKDGYTFFFVCLVEFACEAIWSWTFVCRKCFYYIFNLISSAPSVKMIYFFLVQSWQVVCL